MLQLSLGYIVQADRERDVAEDLRNRQALRPPRELRAVVPGPASQPQTAPRVSVRARGTGV